VIGPLSVRPSAESVRLAVSIRALAALPGLPPGVVEFNVTWVESSTVPFTVRLDEVINSTVVTAEPVRIELLASCVICTDHEAVPVAQTF
jgi:hypothetical protein